MISPVVSDDALLVSLATGKAQQLESVGVRMEKKWQLLVSAATLYHKQGHVPCYYKYGGMSL